MCFLLKKGETVMPLQAQKKIKGVFNVHYPRSSESSEKVFMYLCRDKFPRECDGTPGSSLCKAFRLYHNGEIRSFDNRVVMEAGSSHKDEIRFNKSFHKCRCRAPL